jgi:hypothetical protein
VPTFEAALNLTAPLPLPLAPDVIAIQGTLLAAVQEHPVNVVTFTVPGPPVANTVRSVGVTLKRQGAASCKTGIVCSLILISLWRTEGAGFAAATNSTVPLPCPDAGARLEIHDAFVETSQPHSGAAVTSIVEVPPSGLMLAGPTSVS